MRVLVACEFSGVVRDAFIARGHDAWSCDILPAEAGGPHIQADIFKVIDMGWDMMIAHPPCTYLTLTGNKWMKPEFAERFPDRHQQRADAIEFVKALAAANIPKIAIENPVGVLSTQFRKPEQYVHPYFFGDPERKKTGLWLKNLPKLVPTDMVEPEIVVYQNGKGTDSRWHVETMKLPPHERMKARSKTFPGLAAAMADQWGGTRIVPNPLERL